MSASVFIRRTMRSLRRNCGIWRIRPRKATAAAALPPAVIYRFQVLKQADVVLALFLRSNEFSLEEKRADFEYYDPITTGDSNLSAVMQAIVAAEVGHQDMALDYFYRGLFVDIGDTHGRTPRMVCTSPRQQALAGAGVPWFRWSSRRRRNTLLRPEAAAQMGASHVRAGLPSQPHSGAAHPPQHDLHAAERRPVKVGSGEPSTKWARPLWRSGWLTRGCTFRR